MASENTSNVNESNENNQERFLGRVKWFNNKLGYGFISYRANDQDNDIFCHYSHVKPNNETFRTLSQGEYVEFGISECEENEKAGKYQAVNITGPNSGPLLVDSRPQRPVRRPQNENRRPFRQGDREEWTQVTKRNSKNDNE